MNVIRTLSSVIKISNHIINLTSTDKDQKHYSTITFNSMQTTFYMCGCYCKTCLSPCLHAFVCACVRHSGIKVGEEKNAYSLCLADKTMYRHNFSKRHGLTSSSNTWYVTAEQTSMDSQEERKKGLWVYPCVHLDLAGGLSSAGLPVFHLYLNT